MTGRGKGAGISIKKKNKPNSINFVSQYPRWRSIWLCALSGLLAISAELFEIEIYQ